MSETLLPILLVVQGVIGGVDTLLNHEWIERLPYRTSAKNEIAFHALREAIYGSLFLCLAWFAWYGSAATVIAILVASEIIVTTCDEFIENNTRVLPQNERVLHVVLTLNLGLLIAVLVPTLCEWALNRTGLVRVDYGALSWGLSLLAIASGGWAIRDLIAWRRLHA